MKNSIVLITCLVLVACAMPTPAVQSTPAYDDLAISVEHGPCFGECPVYKLTIDSGGTVNYEGNGFVKVEGNRTNQITSDQIKQLIEAIEDANFFSLDDQYAVSATDLPSVELAITLNGRTKRVRHYGMLDCRSFLDDAPQELCVLENKIEEVVNSDRWVK